MPLTRQQSRVLDYLERCRAAGSVPTSREIANTFGFCHHNAHEMLMKLQLKGRILRKPNCARAVEILEPLSDEERTKYRLGLPPTPTRPHVRGVFLTVQR